MLKNETKQNKSSVSRSVSGQAGVTTFFLRKLREDEKLAANKSVLGTEKAKPASVWLSRQEGRGTGQDRADRLKRSGNRK